MISGSFHPSAQEWRYFSREKSIIHTLHLAQLPTRQNGDTVEIASVAPAATPGSKGFSVPPISFTGGGGSSTVTVATTNTTLSTCYAAVGPNRATLCSKKCIIEYGAWDDNLKEILFTPQENGWFMIHGEFNSGLQGNLQSNGGSYAAGSLWYTFNNSFIANIDRQPVGFTSTQIAQWTRDFSTINGGYHGTLLPAFDPPNAPDTPWNPNFWISSIISSGYTSIFEGIAGLYFRIAIRNRCVPSNVTSDLTGWLFKFAEI